MELKQQSLLSSLKINEKLDLNHHIAEILKTISEEAANLLNAERATIYIYDAQQKELFSYIASELEIDEIRMKLGEGVAGNVGKTRTPVIVNEVESCEFFNSYYDSQTNYVTRNLITTPLLNEQDELVGVLQVLNKKEGDFSDSDLNFLKNIAGIIAISIESTQISHENQILQEYNSLLLENLDAALLILDGEGKIRDYNREFIDFFNLDKSKNVDGYFLTDIENALWVWLNKFFEEKERYKLYFFEGKYYELSYSSLMDTEKKEAGKVIWIRDVTSKIEEQKAREIKNRMTVLGKMSSQIIHDVKNPLFVLRGYIKLLENSESKEDTSRYAATMEREIERILEITQEILDFSRGELDLSFDVISVSKFNAMLLDLMAKIEDIFGIEPTCILANAFHEKKLDLDMGKIERALRNLIVNAIESFEDPSGSVIEIESKTDSDCLYLCIKDKGRGISKENQKRIFQPFETYNKKQGTGLGLPISKAIVEGHQGSLNIIKEEGWSTVFQIKIPFIG